METFLQGDMAKQNQVMVLPDIASVFHGQQGAAAWDTGTLTGAISFC